MCLECTNFQLKMHSHMILNLHCKLILCFVCSGIFARTNILICVLQFLRLIQSFFIESSRHTERRRVLRSDIPSLRAHTRTGTEEEQLLVKLVHVWRARSRECHMGRGLYAVESDMLRVEIGMLWRVACLEWRLECSGEWHAHCVEIGMHAVESGKHGALFRVQGRFANTQGESHVRSGNLHCILTCTCHF